MELFIIIGGCYAFYQVGYSIAVHIDYWSQNKD